MTKFVNIIYYSLKMKNSLFVVLLVSGLNLYGQNDSIEKTTLYSRKLSNEISQDEFLNSWHKWNETIKEINGYPNMPLDQNGQVHYSFINNFPGENKDRLFNITLEWLSINYGLIPSSIYCNKEDGKIILRNNMEMKIGYTCNYTSVITIKNEKMLMEFYNISSSNIFQHIIQEICLYLREPSPQP